MFELWFDYVEYDTNSVLIVVPHNSLVSVGRIAADDSIFLAGKLGGVVAVDIPLNLLLLHLHVLLLLLHCHDEASVRDQLVLRLRLVHLLLFDFLVVFRRWWLALAISALLICPRASSLLVN